MFPDFGVLGKGGSSYGFGKGELEKLVQLGHKELDDKKGISRSANDVTTESVGISYPLLCNRSPQHSAA